jgi:hypoxanthine phosphoribosyltransferase
MIFHSIFKENILRPNCSETMVTPTYCLGMPSAHAEIATMLVLYALFKKKISVVIGIIIVIAVCLQRIITKKHTILQTFIGILFGVFYFMLYLRNGWYILIIFFLYSNILLFLVEKSFTIPDWIKPDTMESIHKKRNLSYFVKLLGVFSPSYQQERALYISWDEITSSLDKIIDIANKSNIKFDAIVGIKTGGAILTDYMTKMNLPIYKIKVSDKRYNCKKKNTFDILDNYIQLYILKKNPEHLVCEGIDNIYGNILLIDECVGSGGTMNTVSKYLYEKGANKVVTAAIVSSLKSNIDITILQRDYTIAVWPWGYDN